MVDVILAPGGAAALRICYREVLLPAQNGQSGAKARLQFAR
jgi:hypothetical protein